MKKYLASVAVVFFLYAIVRAQSVESIMDATEATRISVEGGKESYMFPSQSQSFQNDTDRLDAFRYDMNAHLKGLDDVRKGGARALKQKIIDKTATQDDRDALILELCDMLGV